MRSFSVAGEWCMRAASGVACVLVLAVLAGCGGSSSGKATHASASASETASTLPKGYPTGAPTGLAYAKPGDDVALGQEATVAWQPPSSTVVSALRINVTAIQRTTFAKSFRDWKVADSVKGYAPYFVQASITNTGPADLAGLTVPLYGETSADTLVEPSTFASTFKPCKPSAFPKPFAASTSATVCLVFLVPDNGELTGVTFRPTEQFTPITWRGAVQTLATDPAPSASAVSPASPGTISPSATGSATASSSG